MSLFITVPPEPEVTVQLFNSMDPDSAIVVISLMVSALLLVPLLCNSLASLSFKFYRSIITPPLTAVHVSVSPVTSGGESVQGIVFQLSLQANKRSSSTELQRGTKYTIAVFGENIMGNGSVANLSVGKKIIIL